MGRPLFYFYFFFIFFKSDILVCMSDLNIGLVRYPGYSVTFEDNTGQPSLILIHLIVGIAQLSVVRDIWSVTQDHRHMLSNNGTCSCAVRDSIFSAVQ